MEIQSLMKWRLLVSLLASGIAVGIIPATAKDIDLKKAGRQEKWLWAFDSISGKTPSTDEKYKAYKIVQDEEAGLDKINNVQAAVSSIQFVDFYRRAGDHVTARAKEIKALGKIETAAAAPDVTNAELTKLAQAAQKMAGFHLDKGVALNKSEADRAEALFLSALNIGNKLPVKEMQRSQGYRSLIKFYLENNKPAKANTYTKELSGLMSGAPFVAYPADQESEQPKHRPCPACGRG